ncbi:hypothetical protein VP01_228g4 [Puccinia sorghi]|uniref:Uncharacterized protein n=1 Tax=Puccinia sorghi TaxID=27349 RepID=A0A0L6V7Y5_9BASI|nr:hypothetical protein VP01_228g4 [Puccinia sorghi]
MDDSSRLRPIFIEPQSIVALESFNHILYRPSETMIQSLMAAFLTALHQHSSPHHCPKSDLLKNNPLFILLLTKRIIIHSDTSLPYQPTKNQLEFTFQDIFLPAFLKIRLQHITNQSDSLAKQFIICLSTLATRILRSYHSRIDPIHQILLSVHHLISLQPPQLLSTFDHLSAVQNILTSLQKSRSIHSIFLLEQVRF